MVNSLTRLVFCLILVAIFAPIGSQAWAQARVPTTVAANPVGAAKTAVVLPWTATQVQDADLDDAWARVYIRANPGPFQYTAYEITPRGRAGPASQVKGMMGRKDVVTRLELLSRDRIRALFQSLVDVDALNLPHPPLPSVHTDATVQVKSKKAPKGDLGLAGVQAPDPLQGPTHSAVPVYEVSIRLGGRENSFLVADPFAMADRRYAACVQLIRDLAIATAGEVSYAGPEGHEGADGYLFIDSVPGAQVQVDAMKLPDGTPILGYTVPAGDHTIILENKELGLKRSYKVRVQAGLTTSLEVELR